LLSARSQATNTVQQRSLKVFEQAYKSKAAQNSGGGGGGGVAQQSAAGGAEAGADGKQHVHEGTYEDVTNKQKDK
jgi:hypothetical protein